MWLNKHYWSGSQTNQMNHSKRFFFGLFFCQLSTVLCFFWLKHSLKLIIDNHPSDCRCWTNDEMSFDSRQFHRVVFVSVNYIKRPHTKRKIGKCVLLYSGSLRGPIWAAERFMRVCFTSGECKGTHYEVGKCSFFPWGLKSDNGSLQHVGRPTP